MTSIGKDEIMSADDRPRILAVDDVQDNLDLICEIFENLPYDILTARNAEGALKLAHDESPDVAIIDVQMPEVDGYELCRRLGEIQRIPRMPIIFLTAHRTGVEDVVQGLDLGACDYVTKPVEAAELRARVHAILRERSEHERDINAARTVARRLLGR